MYMCVKRWVWYRIMCVLPNHSWSIFQCCVQETVYNCHARLDSHNKSNLLLCPRYSKITRLTQQKKLLLSSLNPWMKRSTVHSSTGGPLTFMCNCLLQSIWHVGENIIKQKIQILYVPQYSKKQMYDEVNKLCKLKMFSFEIHFCCTYR